MKNNYTLSDLSFASTPLVKSALDKLKAPFLKTAPAEFEQRIKSYIAGDIAMEEGYSVPANQNPHAVKFYWGHDHDFGSFNVSGLMGTRHIWMLDRFFSNFGVDPQSLEGKPVLDIGCWTGGISLPLAVMGAQITAIDEINKYVHALSYTASSFGLDNINTRWMSLYDLKGEDFTGKYDFVFCCGVLYHVSDILVALRRIYHVLKPGGRLLIETMSIDSDEEILEYRGPSLGHRSGLFGWNWFVPSPRVVFKMLEDTGFHQIKVGNGVNDFCVTNDIDPMGANRCFAMATKLTPHVICKAGLSVIID